MVAVDPRWPLFCPIDGQPSPRQENRMWRFQCVTEWCGAHFMLQDPAEAARALGRRERQAGVAAAAIDLQCPWPSCAGLAYMASVSTERYRYHCEKCDREFTMPAADYRAGAAAEGWADAEAQGQMITARVILPGSR